MSIYTTNVKKRKKTTAAAATYQFKLNTRNDQILRQKLQISHLLVLEIIRHNTQQSTAPFIDAD
jgi:hypothetical protein